MGLLMDSRGPRRAGLAAIDWGWDLGVSGGDARNGFGIIFLHSTRVLEESGCGGMDHGVVLIGGWILLWQWIGMVWKQSVVVALRRGQMGHGAELIEGWILLRRWVVRAFERFGPVASQ